MEAFVSDEPNFMNTYIVHLFDVAVYKAYPVNGFTESYAPKASTD